MKIYGDSRSGNCYKVQLVCAFLQLQHEWVHIDVLSGDTRTPDFQAMNPNGKIPVLGLADGRFLWESNAILNYLASGTSLLPTDRYAFAQVLQWQFFEQYSHEPYIAVARFIAQYLGMPEDRREEYDSKHPGGYNALDVMEHALEGSAYLVGESMTTADISLYAYTHVAHEGGFDLAGYPAIRRWLERMAASPGYIPMA
ncbi:MAG: glutathione S-transferase family protein [Chromatocurvus sp.]